MRVASDSAGGYGSERRLVDDIKKEKNLQSLVAVVCEGPVIAPVATDVKED